VYKARLAGEGLKSRRFRLMIYGELPDRLHAEVLSPLGTTELIVDAGGGRVAVTLVDERTSFVGSAAEDVLQRILGLHLELDMLLGLVLGNDEAAPGLVVNRVPATGPGYPDSLEIGNERRQLQLELKRVHALERDPETLGNGRPPDGVEVRPLDELAALTLGDETS